MSNLIWITGLSGSGKTTIGKNVFNKFRKKYPNTIFLDGDIFRKIFGNDLKYSIKERLENARRIHRLCKFLVLQDINVVCATMSLFKEIHALNKKEFKNYYEIFIECEINELIRRDQKNLYSKSKKLKKKANVVGIDLPYNKPKNPNLIIDNSKKNNLKIKVDKIINLIISK
jgi:adenylylsulfate kinase-like enzyme